MFQVVPVVRCHWKETELLPLCVQKCGCYIDPHTYVCASFLMTYKHILEEMLFSAGDPLIWSYGCSSLHLNTQLAGFSRYLASCGLDALSWELALLHSDSQLCSLGTLEGMGIMGKEALYFFPYIFWSTTHPPCAYHYVDCHKTCCAQWEEVEKPHCSVHILYISPSKVFLGFVLPILNSLLKKIKNPAIKIEKPPPGSYPERYFQTNIKLCSFVSGPKNFLLPQG